VPPSSTTTHGSAPVVIVGGGPTGITAAILLAQHGLSVVVLERHHEPYPLPRAVHLDDEVHRILQQVGVGPDFARISRPGAGLRVLDAEHRVLAEFRRPQEGPHGYPQANMFDQPDLERLLRDRLATHHRLVEFRRGAEVVHVDTGADAAGTHMVTFRDAEVTDGRVERVRAAAVLGCDGAGSIVREAMGSRWQDLAVEQRWLVVDGRCDRTLARWDGVDQIADPHRATTFMRVGPDRYRWEFRLRPDEDDRDLLEPEQLARLLSPWTRHAHGHSAADDIRVLRSATYTFRASVADRWRRRRVLLLGDAAHLTPPFIGQGLGAGLRDAANLAWKLARVVTGQSPEALLDSYEAERRRHVTRQIRTARTAGRVLAGDGGTGGSRGDLGAAVRRLALRASVCVPGLAERLLDRGSPPLRGSELTAGRRPYGPRSLIGTLVPQPVVGDGNVRRPLDEVLGRRTAVLTLTAPDPDLMALAVRLGARVLYVGGCPARGTSPSPGVRTIDDDGVLARWLGAAGASTAVVRPDRVVTAVARSPTRPGRELSASPATTALATPRERSPI
jgi:3-(3-hydroxy-phenyl)propionate hydroxylase